jgi:hypothetical protein
MSRFFVALLAATSIAACSSDPAPAEEQIASADPLVQDFPASQPTQSYEEALGLPPPPLVVRPAPPASEPYYPHPGAPLPPVAAPRSSFASACDVVVERTRNGIVLTAVADPDRSMSGDYSFVITKGGGGNSSDIEQGGPFRSTGAGAIELSSSEISLERGSSYRATLRLTSQGREVCRRTVRS